MASATVVTITTKQTLELDEDQVRSALREYFKMPDAEVEFECGYEGFFRSVILTVTTTETQEGPFNG